MGKQGRRTSDRMHYFTRAAEQYDERCRRARARRPY